MSDDRFTGQQASNDVAGDPSPSISPLEGFLQGGLIGLARAMDLKYEAEGADTEGIDDPEALRRAEQAVARDGAWTATDPSSDPGQESRLADAAVRKQGGSRPATDPALGFGDGLLPEDGFGATRVDRRDPDKSDNEYLERMASGDPSGIGGFLRVIGLAALLSVGVFLLTRW